MYAFMDMELADAERLGEHMVHTWLLLLAYPIQFLAFEALSIMRNIIQPQR